MTINQFNQTFMQEMKEKLDVELLGATSVDVSEVLKMRTRDLLPSAKSAVVFGKEIYKEIVSLLKPSKQEGEIESGGLLGPHCEYVNGRLNRAVHDLAALFKKLGYRSLPLPAIGPSDRRFLTSLLSFKHVAELAGLGTIGRHSLLITQAYGPRVRLACLLTEATLDTTSRLQENYCLNCDACIRLCPANALCLPKPGEVYAINRFACQSYRQAGLTCGVCMKVCDETIEKARD